MNLLIARMANTHQRINDDAMQEWSFFVAQTVQDNILVKEKSPLNMLPSPLNLITTALVPLHYPVMKQGISVAGSVADKILIPFGQIQSYFFLLYLFTCGLSNLVLRIFKQKKYLFKGLDIKYLVIGVEMLLMVSIYTNHTHDHLLPYYCIS